MTSKEEESFTTIYSVKCIKFGLHFNIYTWHPEKHNVSSIFCPECGQHEGAFLLWRNDISDPIFRHVPYYDNEKKSSATLIDARF